MMQQQTQHPAAPPRRSHRVWWAVNLYVAGYIAGAATIYYAGPAMGHAMRRTGGRLIGLSGDAPLDTAEEVRAVVETLAREAVTEEAARVVGPARVVRR
jgi:hypothetical protein